MPKQSKLPLIAAILATVVTTTAGLVGGFRLAGDIATFTNTTSSSTTRSNTTGGTYSSSSSAQLIPTTGQPPVGVEPIPSTTGSNSGHGNTNSMGTTLQLNQEEEEEEDPTEELKKKEKKEEEKLREEARKAEEEARRRAEEEAKHFAEEQSRQAAEQLAIQQEALRQAEAARNKQEEQLRNALQVTQQQQEEQRLPGTVQERILSCLDSDGNLTTDRAACDASKTESVSPRSTMTPEQEIILEKRAEELFLGTNAVDSRRQEVLDLIEGTRQRLEGIRDSGLLQGADVDFLHQSIDWLGGAYGYFTAPERTSEDIAMMRTYLSQIIDYTGQLLQQARATAPEINTLVSKTDVILGTFPDIFWILTREGVPTNPKILEEYGAAVNLLNEIKLRCPGEDAQCSRLSEVVTAIESMERTIKNAVAESGKTQVEGMIREAIQARLTPTIQ